LVLGFNPKLSFSLAVSRLMDNLLLFLSCDHIYSGGNCHFLLKTVGLS
jgi:hypothetical protein